MSKSWVDRKTNFRIVPKETKGIPAYVNHESDFAVHPGFNHDGQFVATNMKAEDGREFGFLLHMMCVNPELIPNVYPVMFSIISLSDFTNKTYMCKEDTFVGDEMSYSLNELSLKTPISYMRGDKDKVYCASDLPDGRGRVEVVLERSGPILDNCALGAFPFLNGETVAYQFSLPYLKASGTLTLDGQTTKISGDGWLDRQWGSFTQEFFDGAFAWKWMNLNLNNGYKISCWDVNVHGKAENAWATVMSPAGEHIVVDMVPFSKGESDWWTSPATGQKYATKFVVEIPALDAVFNVKVRDGLIEQEVVSPSGEDKYEAACTFTGRFMGQEVNGFNYVEMVGTFR